QGSEVLKKLDGLVSLLQGGDGHYSSAADADEKLAKLEDLFSTDHWKLKALLVMAFTPQFLVGGTKVRPEEPIAQPEQWDPKSWKKKQKPQKPAKKEKTKLELLLDEIVEQKLAPDRTVACMLEVPKGRGIHRQDRDRAHVQVTRMPKRSKSRVTLRCRVSRPLHSFHEEGPLVTVGSRSDLLIHLILSTQLAAEAMQFFCGGEG
ncbi:unnamed protein product, partial [Prorocentrum cordatum]